MRSLRAHPDARRMRVRVIVAAGAAFALMAIGASDVSARSGVSAPTVHVIDHKGGIAIDVPKNWKRVAARGGFGQLRQRLAFAGPGREHWGFTISTSKDMNLIGPFTPKEQRAWRSTVERTLRANPLISHLRIATPDDLVVGFPVVATYDVAAAGEPRSSARAHGRVTGGQTYGLGGFTAKGIWQPPPGSFARSSRVSGPTCRGAADLGLAQ